MARQLELREVFLGEEPVDTARKAGLVGTIELVADDGRAERREMNADLMLASGLEHTADARVRLAVGAARADRFDDEARGC